MLKKKITTIATGALTCMLALGACTAESTSEQEAQASRSKGMEGLRSKQKPVTMKWSPILESVNKRNSMWEKKGKVSYVYMQRQDGSFAGYYVLTGLPVSYCTSGAPTYTFTDVPNDGDNVHTQVPAPAGDGAYYTGCDANRYYGFDAVTGAYIEYTDGQVLTAVLSDQPLPMKNQPTPFGSSITDVKKKQSKPKG